MQLGFSSSTEWTAGQSSGSNLSVLNFRPTGKKSSGPQMKLTCFKSNHNRFILYTKGQNYMIIKKAKLKV